MGLKSLHGSWLGGMRASFAIAVCALAAVEAGADEHRSALGLSVGSPGVGVTLGRSVNGHFGARITGNFFEYRDDFRETDVTYDAALKLRSLQALLDFHPFESALRLSAGVVLNDNRVEGTALPNAGTLTLNGRRYASEDVGTLTARGDIGERKVASYAGLGFGRTTGRSRVFFTLDLGVIFQGTPHVGLSATGPIASDAGFQNDLAAEVFDVNRDLDEPYFQYYPAIAIGLGFRF
jgi:hypothetical protein